MSSSGRTGCPTPTPIRIHGLREADLADAPPLAERLDRLLEALAGALWSPTWPRSSAASSARPSRRVGSSCAIRSSTPRRSTASSAGCGATPSAASDPVGLSDLARSLGLPVHRPHHADGDALTTAQAFIALATHLEAFENPLTLGWLQKVSEPRVRNPRAGAIRRLIRRLRL